MKQVKFLKRATYGGQMRAKGARVRMSNKHAATLSILGKVKILKDVDDDEDKGKSSQVESKGRTESPSNELLRAAALSAATDDAEEEGSPEGEEQESAPSDNGGTES